MKTKILLIISLFVVSLGYAQYGGIFYFSVDEIYFNKIPVMNANLTGVNNTLPQMGTVFGGGGDMIVKGLVIGGLGYGGPMKKMNINGAKVSYNFGGGQFNLGYVLFTTKKFLSYLYLGIGGASYGVEIENNADSVVSFGTLQAPPHSTVSYDYGGFTLSPGLNFSFMAKVLVIGLNVSYIYPTSKQYGGVLASLRIGFGGASKR